MDYRIADFTLRTVGPHSDLAGYGLIGFKPFEVEESGEEPTMLLDMDCDIKDRFTDLGLIPQTHVKCVGKSPGKDMKAYLVRGAVIALRNADCQSILVSKGEDSLWD